ncbi:MAG: VanW family protein [Clostridia bacterium]|nr:VanW family protein [Clostridia bacterium]
MGNRTDEYPEIENTDSGEEAVVSGAEAVLPGAEDASEPGAGADVVDEDDDMIIAPDRPSAARFEQGEVIEDEVDGLFDGLDEIDDGSDDGSRDGEDDDDFDIESVGSDGDEGKKAVAGSAAGAASASLRNRGSKETFNKKAKADKKKNKKQKEKERRERADQKPSENVGRHAVTTSRGVVYVESYSDDDYEMHTGLKSRVAKIILSLFIIAAVVFAAIMFVDYCRRTVDGDRVYNGITLNGKSVAGLTRRELGEYIDKTYAAPVSGSTITVRAGEDYVVYPLNAIIRLPDTEKLADEIYEYARSGNLVSRAFTVIKLKEAGKNYTLNYSVNTATIDAITGYMNSKNRAKVDPTYTVEEDRVVFTYGSNGLELGSEDIQSSLTEYTDNLLKSLTEGTATNSVSGTVNLVPRVSEFKKLLKINVVNDLPLKAVAPKIERKSATEVWVSPGTDGAEYDAELLDQIIDRINSGEPSAEGTEILPLTREQSFITKEFYESVLFRNVLGKGSNVNTPETEPERALLNENRDKNIALAVSKLDGLVIMPGEVFSFMDSIKAYEAKTGFLFAYENYYGIENPVEGGGIAQVSTALYNAALLADADIVVRTKYRFAPLFGLMGYDAYTSIKEKSDLRIKNNDTFPWRIEAKYTSGTVSVSINGTVFWETDFLDEEGKPIDPELIPKNIKIVKDRPEKELSTQIARRNAYVVNTFSDPNMDEGTTSIYQKGIDGYTLNLYLIVRQGGKEDKQFIGVETYESRSEYIMTGTRVVTPTPTEVPTEEPTPTPTEVPTEIPTEIPTEVPTETPTDAQTDVPETPTEPVATPTEDPGPTDEPAPTGTEEPGPADEVTEPSPTPEE